MPRSDDLLGLLAAEVEAAVTARRAPWFDPEEGEAVLLPDDEGRGHWVGAPSLFVEADGTLLLTYRRRRPRDGSPDERGYLAAIAQSTDGGSSFSDIWSLSKHEVGTSSLERCCLRPSPGGPSPGGGWHLYTSWEDPPESGRWRVDVMSASSPTGFSAASARPVVTAAEVGVDAVKDPHLVIGAGGGPEGTGPELVMYVSTFLTPHGPAPTYYATSRDGLQFDWQGEALGVGTGWDAYQARISSVMPFESGFVAYYDGAASFADDTEERCGLAVSVDLRTWRRVTTTGPALVSPHATGSLRYADVSRYGGRWWVYYEYARADGSHELRRNVLAGP